VVLPVQDQVQLLIAEATSLENLCQCFIGWCVSLDPDKRGIARETDVSAFASPGAPFGNDIAQFTNIFTTDVLRAQGSRSTSCLHVVSAYSCIIPLQRGTIKIGIDRFMLPSEVDRHIVNRSIDL
jgi:hypothetical protein